jgi:hypothetical protein
MIGTAHPVLLVGQIKKTVKAGHAARMVERRGAVHTGFWWGNLRERNHLEDPSVDGKIELR